MHQLMGLREKLDLANAAAPLLQIEARPDIGWPLVMIPDPSGQQAHFFHRAKIHRRAPDKRINRIEKTLAARNVSCRGAGADESCTLPRQSRALIMCQSRSKGNRRRRNFGRWPQPQIDAKDIPFSGQVRQSADNMTGIALRGFCRFIRCAARQGVRIEQKDRINVR